MWIFRTFRAVVCIARNLPFLNFFVDSFLFGNTFDLLLTGCFSFFLLEICMSAVRLQPAPNPNQLPYAPRRCKRINPWEHCAACVVIDGSQFLVQNELRQVGCCGNNPCDSQDQQVIDTIISIANTLPANAANEEYRYLCYRHLVCIDGFGQPIPGDTRLLLNCCIIHQVRCTWPSPIDQYRGHRTIEGYEPITTQ